MDELLCGLTLYDLFTISADLDRLCRKYYGEKVDRETHNFWCDVYNHVRDEINDRYVDEYVKGDGEGKIAVHVNEDGTIFLPYPHLRKNLKHLSISGLKNLREEIDKEIERQVEKFNKEVEE